MTILYNLSIFIYRTLIMLLSPFNKKAGLWHRGRKNFFSRWGSFKSAGRRVIWIHCASLGEFEQGRPLIEKFREAEADSFILLTFFSPSGYEIRKDYELADAVCYLPADTPANARRFVQIFRPDIAVFVKYEFWYNYISELSKNAIPVYLISANFRKDQVFFRWYGKWFGRMLHCFTHIFVQSENSRHLLQSIGAGRVSVAGDTRFDRVRSIAASRRDIPLARLFSEGSFTIVAGSTWPGDHDLLVRLINEQLHEVKFIIAPHEIHEETISGLERRIGKMTVRYSKALPGDVAAARVLIIDNIGLLSSLYSYGKIAYIGGGFGRGIHNILEAATYGMPVIFGPNYKQFREASALVERGGAFPVNNFKELSDCVDRLIRSNQKLGAAGRAAKEYVEKNAGATSMIADRILSSGTHRNH